MCQRTGEGKMKTDNEKDLSKLEELAENYRDYREFSSSGSALESMPVVYKDALRRGMEVGKLESWIYYNSEHIEFSVRLGDKPRIWGVAIDNISLSVRGYFREHLFHHDVFLIQSPGAAIKHPHVSWINDTLCVGVNLSRLLILQPNVLIPNAIQAASTVTGRYMIGMAESMVEVGVQVPQHIRDEMRRLY